MYIYDVYIHICIWCRWSVNIYIYIEIKKNIIYIYIYMYNHFCMHVCLSVCYILCKLYNIVIWCNMYIFASLCLPIIRLGQPFVGTYNHQNVCKGLAIVSPGNMLRCSHNLSRLFRIHVFQIKKATKTLPAASRLVDGTKRPFLHAKTDIDSIFESPSGPLHIFRFDIEIMYLKYRGEHAPNPKKKAFWEHPSMPGVTSLVFSSPPFRWSQQNPGGSMKAWRISEKFSISRLGTWVASWNHQELGSMIHLSP